MFVYRAVNDGCNCEEYRTRDGEVEYLFRANYRMRSGILTSIEIELINHSNTDTLSTDVASTKVSSRNVSYQYNDRFLPMPSILIVPRERDVIRLQGKEVTGVDDWHKIAGEQLTLTIKGILIGKKQLKQQQLTFVPENPKLQQ